MRRQRPGTPDEQVWHGAGAGWRAWSPRACLWWFLFPRRLHRTGVTLSGLLLIVVAIAIGTAAYNSANNILFLTLSLLLACIILSGVLSALNFRALSWRVEVPPPVRAGQPHPVSLLLRNGKRFLPTYSLWFELRLNRAEQSHELALRDRLEAGSDGAIEVPVVFPARGRETLELAYVGSQFPFGFLRKALFAGSTVDVVVWPAPVEYRRLSAAAWQQSATGEEVRRVGQSGDLLALRRYQTDDSHRQIHWKASARMRQLMVRQMSAENGQGYSLWVDASAERWPRAEQFELLCSFAATLAEDLFKSGRLRAVGLRGAPMLPVRGLRDLEIFLDRLAVATPEPVPPTGAAVDPEAPHEADGRPHLQPQRWHNLLTFAPDGVRGVAAYIHGEKAAAA